MTEESNALDAGNRAPDDESSTSDSELDGVIVQLVRWANEFELSIAITVLTDGGVMSGHLIGIREYYRLFAEQWDGPGAEGMVSMWRDAGEQVWEDIQAEKELPPTERTQPRHLHFRDARFLSGPGLVPTPPGSIIWRGRLDRVIGFSMGILGVGEHD